VQNPQKSLLEAVVLPSFAFSSSLAYFVFVGKISCRNFDSSAIDEEGGTDHPRLS